ncbi:MAG: Rrf2 family transcriptional regulator [Acidobacteriota bacterium]
MLRLSKKADYALIAVTHLTVKTGSSSAREIAELFDIPVELMAKVLQRLTRRGLLTSQQGTHGGYQLARAASGISIADVIQAIDGPVAVTACSAHADRCGQFAKCNVRDPLWKIREIIVSALKGTTVLALANDVMVPGRLAPPAQVLVHGSRS